MTDFGVIPTGFNRKPLAIILAEIESKFITEFGPDVIQTPQSPLGQINGLMADFVTQFWEIAEDVYQSYDVDQAEGRRLDALAKLRLLRRGAAESEVDFRRALTNQGRARIDIQDISRAVQSVAGVTYAKVFLNESNEELDDGLIPPGSMAIVVLGGDESELAAVLRQYIVPGISTYGNTYVASEVEGFCRTVALLRPTLIPVDLTVNVRTRNDNDGCPPPSLTAVKNALVAALGSEMVNGNDVNHFRIRSIVERQFPSIEVISISAKPVGSDEPGSANMAIAFSELATFSVDETVLTSV